MENAQSSPVLGSALTTLYRLGAVGTLTDGQLLKWSLARNDPAGPPRPPSACWSSDTVRWSWASAKRCWATRMMLTTPSRPLSWSWSARPARSVVARRSGVGCSASRGGSPRRGRSRRRVVAVTLQALFDDQPASRDALKVGAATRSRPIMDLIDEIYGLPNSFACRSS